jgi:tetratricopeptide (TPR) repeat protein
MASYDQAFYKHQKEGSLKSAETVVPMIMQLLNPRTVVDIGCGVGTWLSVYRQHGVQSVLGVDGDYVDRRELLVSENEFLPRNLSEPLHLNQRYDLVQSLEVAEHLDGKHAEQFVATLTGLSDVVLFSAAVPFQLGTEHVNEQFIDYWARLFQKHDYHAIDCIRPAIWDVAEVEVCYRQNMLIFSSGNFIATHKQLKEAHEKTNPRMLSLIHPELYTPRINRLLAALMAAAKQFHVNGNLKMAEPIYRQIIAFNINSSEAWDLYGQLALQVGDLNAAVDRLNRAIRLNPAEPAHHCNLGRVFVSRGEWHKARSSFNAALKIDSGYLPALEAIKKLPPQAM